MFAVIRTGGKQYRVQEGDVLCVEKINKEKGQRVTFEEVLLIEDGKETLIGTPFVDNARVKAEIVENFKDNKVIVFKKKRRKQYRRTRGHRQELSRIKIEEIALGAKAAPEKAAVAIIKEKEKPVVRKRRAPREMKEEGKKEVKREAKAPGKVRVAKAEKPKSKTSSKVKTKAKTAAKADKPTLKKE